MTYPTIITGLWRPLTLRQAASSLARVLPVRALPASLPCLVIERQSLGVTAGQVIN
jgi:hypothetical protein